MKPLTEDISKILQTIIGRKDPLLAEIVVHWSDIVDMKFSSISYPFKIVSYKKKGVEVKTLYIKTSSSVVSMEMSYKQDVIIERIAIYLGHKSIHQLRLLI